MHSTCDTRLIAMLTMIFMSFNGREARPEETVSTIKADEQVVFFPTVACLAPDCQSWTVPIHGWIFEPEESDWLRNILLHQLRNIPGLDVNGRSSKILDDRIRLFLVDNERGKKISIRLGDQTHELMPSDVDGHFTGTIRISAAEAARFADGMVRFAAVTDSTDRRQFHGYCHLLSSNGVSVISDVDDTIKVTNVNDARKLIENTLFREFQAVDGMSDVYRRWAKAGAQFHYVSASPWQLYDPLSQFVQAAGFPSGTFHLKRFRLKDSSFLKLFEDPIPYKLSMIEPLVESFPDRKFILVGDSGQKDPEIYGIVARRYPSQVTRVYIRDVTGEPADSTRYDKAFQGCEGVWHLFADATELRWPED
jgi:phosphatidate phosphatase APP1